MRSPLREYRQERVAKAKAADVYRQSGANQHPLQSRFLQLQKTAGNRTVRGMLQAKLAISQPGDKWEREADRIADAVMRMPERQVQPNECLWPPCKDGDKFLQEKSVGSVSNAHTVDHPLIQIVLSSHGQPLDAAARSFMAMRFGRDFSGVRVHTGSEAAEAARMLHARAYTIGEDVVFGENQYSPGTSNGRRLIAHELTHVVQQANSDGVNDPVLMPLIESFPVIGPVITFFKCQYYLSKMADLKSQCSEEEKEKCKGDYKKKECLEFWSRGWASSSLDACVARKDPELWKNMLKSCGRTAIKAATGKLPAPKKMPLKQLNTESF